MGCHTIYLVREGGQLRAAGDKYGRWDFASPDDARETLALHEGREWTPRTPIQRSWCSGWYLDFDARLARGYRCLSQGDEPCELDRALRARPGWSGWDIGIAWERELELAALAGLPIGDDEHLRRLDEWVDCKAHGLLTGHPDPLRFPHRWDPDANRIELDFFYEDDLATTVTSIDERDHVRDYGFEDPVLFEALGQGPPLLAILRDHAPLPALYGSEAGAVVDERERTVRLWLDDAVAPATYAALRQRWPGWTVERETEGFGGHLARTGRGETTRGSPRRSFVHVEVVEGVAIPPAVPEDEARLLAQVASDPESDDPRRAYADLLCAKGDPRGEFIRASLALAPLEDADDRSPRRHALEARTRELRRMYMRERVGASVLRYRRGFIASVQVGRPADLLQQNLLERVPTLEELNLWAQLEPAMVRELAAWPGLERLRSLEITPAPGALEGLTSSVAHLRRLQVRSRAPAVAAELAAVLAAGALPRLEELVLAGHGFDPDGLVAVAHALPSHVRSLRLWDVVLGDAPSRLASCASLANLRRLELDRVDSADALTLAASPHLAELREWSQESAIDGAELLARLPGVRALELRYNGLDASLVASLAASPHLARLRRLAFRQLSREAADALAASPYLDGILELRVETFGTDEVYASLRARLGERLVIGP